MKRKVFTLLMAFLTTVGNAVWAETNPQGTSDSNPYDLATRGKLEITDSGEYHVTCSSQTGNGITISGNNANPTVYLEGINISVNGTAIEIEYQADPTFILVGENKITSGGRGSWWTGDDAAVNIALESTLTISEESTGILDINMTSDDEGRQMAIGNAAIDDANCGSLTIKGGTVKTNGRLGRFDLHGFRLQDNAVVIAQEIKGFTYNDESLRAGGLLYLDGATTGEFHNAADDPDFTLNSPLPEPYKIKLEENGVKLEIGNGQTLNEDQLSGDGYVKGYKVSYSSPTITNVTTAELPTTKFVSGAYQVETWNDNAQSSDQSTKYARVDKWLLDNAWISAGTELGAPSDYTQLPNIETKGYEAVWYLQSKSIDINLTGTEGKFTGSFELWYPDESTTLFNATEQTSGNLAAAGLKLSDDDKNTIIGLDAPLTDVTEGTKTVTLNITPTNTTNAPSGLTTTLTVNINIDELDLNDNTEVTVTLGANDNLIYDGTEKAINITVNNATSNTPISNKYYTLVYNKKNADNDSYGEDLTSICDAGTYKVTVKATDAENAILTGSKEAGTVTIQPAALTVKGVSPIEWNIGEAAPDYTTATFTLETIYSVGETLDEVSINKEAEGFSGEASTESITLPGTYTVNYSGLELTGSRAFNYTLGETTTAKGNLIASLNGSDDDPIDDTDQIQPGEDGWTLDAETNNWTRMYDGKSHKLGSVKVKYLNEEGSETEGTITLSDDAVSYALNGADVDDVKDAGTYIATISFPDENNYGYKEVGQVTLVITKADLTITVSTTPQVSVGTNLEETEFQAAAYLTASSNVEGEDVNFNGNLTLKDNVSAETERTIEDAFSHENVTLVADEVTGSPFKESNYNVKWPGKIGLVVGKITLDPDPDGDGNEDITGGEDTNNDGNLDENDFILITSDDTKLANSVYDGQSHELAKLEIGDRMLTEGTDYEVSYKSEDEPSVDEEGLPLHAADYTITVTLKGAYQFADNTTEKVFNAAIAQRSMTITFVKEVSSLDELKDINKLVQCDGIVKGEWPEISAAITAKAIGNNRYSVSITSISISNSNSFYFSDYNVSIDKNGDGVGDEEITDEDGDGSGVWEGDDDDTIDIEITVNPGKDDDDDTPGHGGSDINRPAKYYNIYVDTTATSDGVELSLSKDVVKEGNQVSVYIDKILEGYNAENMKVQIKRSLYGYWEEIEEGVQPGEYIIYNIYTDIYVKVTDVEKEDVTGIDDLEGVKAYTKDGSIYVYTPNREEVIIISMSGAIIKNEEQVGLQSYSVSRGIYIVRVGDKVFKLKN